MNDMPSRAVMLFGTDEPPAETRILRAGPLTAELDAGNLRYIRFGGREAIRAISYVARDAFWGTDAAEFSDLVVDQQADGFTVTYSASCRRERESYSYRATITGTPTSLSFEATGAGDTDFLTCRTGFVVLHGVEGIVGEKVTVEHVDGSVVESVFPEIIDPDCPFREIRALTHSVTNGATVRCEMTGDTFEMEDQRNWTDASFKTYVRPLALPKPFTLPAGEEITQTVTLTFDGAAPAEGGTNNAVSLTVGGPEGSLPQVGMWIDAADIAAANTRLEPLAALNPAFLSIYLDATLHDAGTVFAGLRDVVAAVSAPLALEVIVPGENPAAELRAVADAATAAGLNFADVAVSLASDMGFVQPGTVFPDMQDFEDLYAAARLAFPGARIGGGNFVYFTELNRKPVPAQSLDYVLHGTTALVHAADDRSVTETLECLPSLFTSMRAAYGNKHYRVSPVGIGSRTSPFGNEPTPNPDAVRVTMTGKDPRQRGLLGAAWHLGYVAQAAASGVDSLALGTPVGGFGLSHTALDYSQPWFDQAGGVYPAFQVMRRMYSASGAARRTTEVSSPRNVQALCFDTEDGRELWLANLTGEELCVEINGFDAHIVAVLDESSFRESTGVDAKIPTAGASSQVALAAYATAILTQTG